MSEENSNLHTLHTLHTLNGNSRNLIDTLGSGDRDANLYTIFPIGLEGIEPSFLVYKTSILPLNYNPL